jgi:solute carrier family 10 (sodium/bile acid cotransporter), member 7
MAARFFPFIRVDPYLVALVFTVVLAAVFPAQGVCATAVRVAVGASIAGLFFAYGVKLATAQMMTALLHWRPQVLVFATTYVVFPVLGLFGSWVFQRAGMADVSVAHGMLFLTILPSTVQSSIAFTSIAKGNVASALCSASVSNLAGVFLVPLLVSLLISAQGSESSTGGAVKDIALQILLPFLVGQAARPRLASWFERHKVATMLFDRGSILLVVYSAFSAGMLAGVWNRVSTGSLLWVLLFDVVLLASVMTFTLLTSRALGFARADEIAIVFCGSKKSMASGIPMANVLFSASVVSVVVIPLMVFHQLQLFVCAVLAQRYARRSSDTELSNSV